MTDPDLTFAREAAKNMERLTGRLLVRITTEDAPSRRAKRMAEVMITATLIKKLDMSRDLANGFGASVDAVLEQIKAQSTGSIDDMIDLGRITIPDGPGDYINLYQPDDEESVQ